MSMYISRLKIARWILRKPTFWQDHRIDSHNGFCSISIYSYVNQFLNQSYNHWNGCNCFLTNWNESAPLNGINAIAKGLNLFGFDVTYFCVKNLLIIKSLLIISTITKMHIFILKITGKKQTFYTFRLRPQMGST